MRKCFITAATATLLACGGSSGGGGGGGGGPLSGTLAGAPFTPTDGGAIVVAPTTCTVGSVTIHVSALLIGFGSFSGLCSFAQTNGLCADKANAIIVSNNILKGGLVQTPTAVGPGDYTVTTGTAVPDANGNFTVAPGNYNKTNATCVSVNSSSANPGGKITISSVTSTNVTGTMANVTFADGSYLNGSFDVPICSVTVDICALLNNTLCTTRACIP